MAAESYYFSHDYSARNDPKMQKVLMLLGQAGKGVYWDLIEMLYEEGGYLSLNEIESYAFALRTDTDCITKLINGFDLFQNDSKIFWSDSVLKRLFLRNEKSLKASKSASIRWEKHKQDANALESDANALQTECDSNAIKEKKEKEKERIEKEMIVRKQKFAQSLTPFIEIFGKDIVNEFYAYWTEPNKSKTKFRQELEKTWDTKRRIETWVKNDFSKKEKNSAQKEKPSKLETNITVFENVLKQYQ